MKVFDCHTHIENSFKDYDLNITSRKNVIFNTLSSFKEFNSKVEKDDTMSLIFDFKKLEEVESIVKLNNISAFKIHSREQQITNEEYPFIIQSLSNFSEIPIIYDAFYFGDDIKCQPSLFYLIELAKAFPKRKIVVAHSGGYELLKYFFHLRTLPNIFYDLSFSLQYLSDSSILEDLIKLIKYTPKEKILFGSDYHWASPTFQFEVLSRICNQLELSNLEKEKIFYYNAEEVFCQ